MAEQTDRVRGELGIEMMDGSTKQYVPRSEYDGLAAQLTAQREQIEALREVLKDAPPPFDGRQPYADVYHAWWRDQRSAALAQAQPDRQEPA